MSIKISSIIESAYSLPNKFCSLECGACDPEYVETSGWKDKQELWLLEPNLDAYTKLKKLDYNVLNLALSDNNEQKTFYISKHIGFCYLESSNINDSKKNNESILKSYQVECIKYKSLQEKLGITFDILILDIEGQEDIVLKDLLLLEKKLLPKILCVECGYEWTDRKEICKKLGYNLDFYYYNNAYFSLDNSFIKKIDVIDNYNKSWPNWCHNEQKIYDNENTNI